MPPWKYPVPSASPFIDAQQYIPLLLGAIDLELDRADVWEDDEADTALGYIEDLKQYIMLNFGATAPGGSMDYVKLSHTVASGTNGGSSSAGAWYTRTLNSEDSDSAGICSLASNEFQLAAGTYQIMASSVLYLPRYSQIRLYNVSDSTPMLYSMSEYSGGTTDSVSLPIFMSGRFSIASTKTLRIEYRVSFAHAVYGLGLANTFGVNEVYAVVELWRI